VIAAVTAGGVLTSTPAHAALPPAACARLAIAIETLTDLALQFPDNPLIAAFLERAIDAFVRNCL